ncbi:hypothetical protein ACFL01_03990 [Planctomycetota bacterium]
MRIRTSLLILSATSVVLTVVIGLITFRAFHRMNTDIEKSINAGELIEEILELNTITYDFLMYREKRMRQQWTPKYGSVGRLLEAMVEGETHPKRLPHLASMSSDYRTLVVRLQLLIRGP